MVGEPTLLETPEQGLASPPVVQPPELNVQEEMLLDILTRLANLEGGGKCSADFPHKTLSWSGHLYRCQCGMIYEKRVPGRLKNYEGVL